mmetsp:Transcript_24566/g.28981  ORF Transcript_24566/g.28981 Transcript_24566/m.28981 type:complete len:192 (-) Transcript_24566:53-628(-)|eukprot:CAMPEP_0198270978 /NCGR_PEP_ID=MMETSP1447-20131203/47355_1 /TAXON_ID=420782 /ORGANISM="Chaetoceros dichaeta, Strain CCMP1751" /LENGTH=191 /DNA_ID=CAMNT_0043963331 /DNA_START=41 /DNA_END=616 /DNA_ORIENTATION=-
MGQICSNCTDDGIGKPRKFRSIVTSTLDVEDVEDVLKMWRNLKDSHDSMKAEGNASVLMYMKKINNPRKSFNTIDESHDYVMTKLIAEENKIETSIMVTPQIDDEKKMGTYNTAGPEGDDEMKSNPSIIVSPNKFCMHTLEKKEGHIKDYRVSLRDKNNSLDERGVSIQDRIRGLEEKIERGGKQTEVTLR